MNAHDMLRLTVAGALAALQPVAVAQPTEPLRPNVLFIVVDDLRPELGCYGSKRARSPRIDQLAARGTLFSRAYCQQAVCAPSRASVLSGCRPDTTGIFDLRTPLRKAMPEVLTLPQFFKNHGYRTASIGKVYHHGQDDHSSWNRELHPGGAAYALPANQAIVSQRVAEADAAGKNGMDRFSATRGPSSECADVEDDVYTDGQIARAAIKTLQDCAGDDSPFFLAVGFSRPHLPFVAPKKYWDLYDPSKLIIPDRSRPADAPAFAFAGWGELRSYSDIPAGPGHLDDELTRRLIHGYLASVSYVDSQIGLVVQELDRLGLSKNTIIVLWGDHGWKLGEFGDWCKHTNLELDTHVPLVVVDPTKPAGQRCDALVELVDIFPTLAELTGLDPPAHCEGDSLVPLMVEPVQPWKPAVFSQYPRHPLETGRLMGYSLTDGRWRYTQWHNLDNQKIVAQELYDLRVSPVATQNLIDDPSLKQEVDRLSELMRAGWRSARRAPQPGNRMP